MSYDVEAERDAALAWEERKHRLTQPPTLVGARDMLRAAEIETPFLVPGMIPAGAITLIVGEPGAKKSWLAYALAISTAQGGTWLGRPVTPMGPTCNVLVLNYDNPTNECGRRFARLGMQPDDPIFFHSVDVDPLRLPKAAEDLLAIFQAIRPSLVIVDSLRQSHDADENSSKEMAVVMGCMKQLRGAGAAVVIVHHAGKSELVTSGTGKARGSGEIVASADAQINVSKSDEQDDVDVAVWAKHRSWNMPTADESKAFEVIDIGDASEVREVT